MNTFLQYVLDSASIGSIYALMALGLALLFGVLRLVNFAYGELIMIGGYTLYGVRGLPWPLAIIATIAAVIVVSLLMDLIAFRPLRGASTETLMITSFAISFALQNAARMAAGARAKGLRLPEGLTDVFFIGGLRISHLQVVITSTTVLILIGLAALLKKTTLGIQLRAAAEDFTMARLLGIRASRTIAAAFAITGFVAGVVSLLVAARTGNVFPTMGLEPLLVAFIAAVLGGFGSLSGAVVGGFAVGFVTGGLQSVLPVELGPYRTAFLFAAVIAALLIRPQGLLRRSGRAWA